MKTSPFEETKLRGPFDSGPAPCCLVKIYPLDINRSLITLADGPFVVGRDPSCDLCLCDDSVSRRHACIERLESFHVVNDLESTNGTYVNAQRVVSQQLQAGDRLRFGNQILKFLSQDHIEAQYHETVYSMMTRDGLTGAYNKRYFLDALQRDIERCERHKRPMSLILLDIDHFKQINDQYGHLAGDEVLQQLARRLHSVVRKDEVFARYGGEEFVVLMGETTLEDAVVAAERCRSAISDHAISIAGAKIPITVSAGIAEFTGCEEVSASMLIEQADRHLYNAKKLGRNQVQF